MAYPGYEINNIDTVFGFGKYNRYSALEVAKIHPSYFSWCAENLNQSSPAFYFSVKAYYEIKMLLPTFKLSEKAVLSLAVFYDEWRIEYIKMYDSNIEEEFKKLSIEISMRQDEEYARLMDEKPNEKRR
jgi:hypothetical protein